ncbi:Plexin-B [Portunus trituberculatus]|uniref:Plexin-B n=1 Tax=Portunus trituberculatus TaxID=210409 RepID=A0A5B7GYU7_PORTR|nr:Plexin-B [Portunus trituberculatus]
MSVASVAAAPGGPGGRGAAWVRWRAPHLLVLLVLAGTGSGATTGAGAGAGAGALARDSLFIVETYEDKPSQQFTHLTVDKNTGTVYVGGVNRLYQLDPNLRPLHTVVTGPVNDSLECSASASDCKGETAGTMKATDNVNKVLVIDYIRSRLIVCGTVRQGSCQVRGLHDINIHTRNVSEAIVANNATASTVAFIAPGPPNPPVTHVMYIGVTYTGKSVYRDEVPAVASRSLEDDRFFEIAVTEVTTSTRMLVNSLARERYPITYVYGFGSEKFSYFLTRQLEDTYTGFPYISKLVRVCQNDSAYYSYTEIPIECKDSQGKRYNLAQAAYVGKPGTDLATQLGIQTNDDVLFAVFSPSDPSEAEGSARPADASALCVYSMKSVRRMFINNIQECFRGKGDRGLDFISPSHRCIETPKTVLATSWWRRLVNTGTRTSSSVGLEGRRAPDGAPWYSYLGRQGSGVSVGSSVAPPRQVMACEAAISLPGLATALETLGWLGYGTCRQSSH